MQKETWIYPVSRAFYEKLRAKGEQIFKDLGYGRLWTDELMKLVNEYMLRGERPQRRWADETLLTIFMCLRPDIDQAILRSAEARRRAAERHAAKNMEKATEQSESRSNGHQSSQNDVPVLSPDTDLHIPTPTDTKIRNKRIRRNAMARRHP